MKKPFQPGYYPCPGPHLAEQTVRARSLLKHGRKELFIASEDDPRITRRLIAQRVRQPVHSTMLQQIFHLVPNVAHPIGTHTICLLPIPELPPAIQNPAVEILLKRS